MNTKTDAQTGSALDTVKWLVAGLLVAGGMVGFYYFSDILLLLRILSLLAVAGIAIFIVFHTAKGQQTWRFIQDTHLEVRKVVWPSRQETIHTTIIVIVMVLIIALMIWVVDSILFWIVKTVTG
jgi:preprotein translocase subunit SecE